MDEITRRKSLLVAALTLSPVFAYAELMAYWDPPQKYENGTPIVNALEYQLWWTDSDDTFDPIKDWRTTETQYPLTGRFPGGRDCIRIKVTAIDIATGLESQLSNEIRVCHSTTGTEDTGTTGRPNAPGQLWAE